MMMMRTLNICLLTFIILSPLTSSFAAPKDLDEYKSIYDAEEKKIAELNLVDIVAVQQAYSNYVATELKKAINAGGFKTYEKLEQEKLRFDKEKTLPADSPFQKSLAQAEAKRIALINDFSVRYVSAIKAHQTNLMKAKDIDGARLVQTEIDRVQALISEYASKLPSSKPKSNTATVPAPGKLSLTKPAAITVSHYNTELLVGNSIASYGQILLTETPKELKGYFFTQMSKNRKGGAEDVQFEVTEGGIVYRFGLVAPEDEWKETGWTVSINVNGNINKLKVYKKTLIKGIYTLPKGNSLIFQNK